LGIYELRFKGFDNLKKRDSPRRRKGRKEKIMGYELKLILEINERTIWKYDMDRH